MATLRSRRWWTSWRQSRLEKRIQRERRRLLLLHQLERETMARLEQLEEQRHPQLFLETEPQPEPEYLVTPQPGQLPTVELVEPLPQPAPHPLSMAGREPTPVPEPEETQPPALLEIAQRLGLPAQPS
jgi:hypothetical protein